MSERGPQKDPHTDGPQTDTGKRLWAEEREYNMAGQAYLEALCAIEQEARAMERERLRELDALCEPDGYPQPIGRVRRKWWMQGWLTAQAAMREALAEQDHDR